MSRILASAFVVNSHAMLEKWMCCLNPSYQVCEIICFRMANATRRAKRGA